MARLNPEIHSSPEKAPTTRNHVAHQTRTVPEAQPSNAALGTEDSKTPIPNSKNIPNLNSPLTPSIPHHLRPQPFSTAAMAQPPTPTTARTRDNLAIPQKSSPLKPQVAATPSSFDNFMLKMKRKADKQRTPAQPDSPSVQEDVFFTPEARPARTRVSLDEVTSTIDEALDSMKIWGEEVRGSQSSLNMSLLNSGLPSSLDSGLKAVRAATSTTGFGGARPLPALPNRPKSVERLIPNPQLFESRPETNSIGHIQSAKPTTPKEEPKTPAKSPAEDEDLEEHIAKLQRCLEIHSLLLTRVNALPIEDNSTIIPQLHSHLSSCERRLHYLLRNAPGSAFRSSASSSLSAQQELAERCVDTLEMLTRETFAVEARNTGENEMTSAGVAVTQDLEADGGVDVEAPGSGSQGRSEVEDSSKLSPGEVSKKKRRGHRGPRKSKSKKKGAAAVSDELHSETEEEDVWQGGVPLRPGEVVLMKRRIESAETERV